MSTRRALIGGSAVALTCLAVAYLLYGLDSLLQLSFALILGVVASYVASVIFSRRVQRTIIDIVGLDVHVFTLSRDLREMRKRQLQLTDMARGLPADLHAQVWDIIRAMDEIYQAVKETVDRMDQSIRVFKRIGGSQ